MRMALLIDEFFGEAGTAFGGYGFLAKNIICKHLASEDFKIAVLLNRNNSRGKSFFRRMLNKFLPTEIKYDENVNLYFLPKLKFFTSLFLRRKNYDLYLSIELTDVSYEIFKLEKNKKKKLLLWVQDPRPERIWKNEIASMGLIKEFNFFDSKGSNYVKKLNEEKRVEFF